MDIGTAKPSVIEREGVVHHMIDLVGPEESFSVAEFTVKARKCAEDILARGKLPCVVGGTGLYIRALLGGLADLPQGDAALRQQLQQQEHQDPGCLYLQLQERDPVAAARMHPRNLIKVIRALEVCILSGKRMSDLQRQHQFSESFFSSLSLAPLWERPTLNQRIAARTGEMVRAGLLEETESLIDNYGLDLKNLQTLGYREAVDYLQGQTTEEEMINQIVIQTRRYAKRQMTWFKKEPETIWVDSCEESDRVLKLIDDLITVSR